MTETWLNHEPDGLFLPKEYQAFRCDRGSRGGGVALIAKKKLRVRQISIPPEYKHIEIVCVDIYTDSSICRAIIYYRPGGFNSESVDYTLKSIQCLTYLCNNTKLVCIMGDFNLPEMNWKNYSHPKNEIYNLFTSFIDEMGLHQYVESPTRQSNILDLLFSNDACFLSQIQMMPPIAQSDHNTLVFNLPSQPKLSTLNQVLLQKSK